MELPRYLHEYAELSFRDEGVPDDSVETNVGGHRGIVVTKRFQSR
ncbi:Uncharacterised protein [Bacillus freudenreichii]|nr:Uncharacterised protein [Bacillus freudenreichii]